MEIQRGEKMKKSANKPNFVKTAKTLGAVHTHTHTHTHM